MAKLMFTLCLGVSMKLLLICEEIGPKVMFHGTSNIESIMRDGLQVGHKNRIGDVRGGLYIGKLELAAPYGQYLVEIVGDYRNQYADEDDLARLADQDNINWLDCTNVPEEYRQLVHDSVMDYGGWEANDVPHIADLIKKLTITVKDPSSMMIPSNIGFDGPTKIVAIYRISKVGKGGRGTASADYRCEDVLYGAGSLHIGQVFRAASSIWF